MKKAPQDMNQVMQEDVKDLVEQSTLAEATEKVWERFEAALGKLDEDSLKLLRGYFNGDSVATLSRAWGLSEAETQAWLTRKRQELVRNLRQQTRVRQ